MLTLGLRACYSRAVNQATELAGKAASDDPAVGLRAVAALHRLLERFMVIQVRNARARGWSWEEIASALGVSRQAVHKKYRGQIP